MPDELRVYLYDPILRLDSITKQLNGQQALLTNGKNTLLTYPLTMNKNLFFITVEELIAGMQAETYSRGKYRTGQRFEAGELFCINTSGEINPRGTVDYFKIHSLRVATIETFAKFTEKFDKQLAEWTVDSALRLTEINDNIQDIEKRYAAIKQEAETKLPMLKRKYDSVHEANEERKPTFDQVVKALCTPRNA